DAGGARELAQFVELAIRVDPLRQHRDDEPALGLGTRRRIRLAWRHAEIMTFKRQNPHVRDRELPRRLAEGTLALVNIPSVSRLEAEAMAHVRAELPLEPVWASDDVLFATSERRAGRPL